MFGKFSKEFHKQTDFSFPLGSPPSDPQYWPKEWREIYHKEYPRLARVSLSQDLLDLGDFEGSLMNRSSLREFDISKSLTMDELSTLLLYSIGVKPSFGKWASIRRFYPSGGARYPLEVYLLIQRVDGIIPGIYHYNVKDHILETLSTDKEDLSSLKDGLYYPWSRDAAVACFITAVWDRNFMKYKDRGYRIVLIESGHMAQNIALTASALNIGCCNSVGFHNSHINETLDIEHEDEDSLCMALLGK
ncbi:MAG: SagB/ThcOx family dehydrogenase [Parcubacteria group bacterium]|jgi:SagB-type dehydrogenase family enzyme